MDQKEKELFIKRINKINRKKVINMVEKTKDPENTRKLILKDSVGVGALLGFVGWIIYTMATNKLMTWGNWDDAGFKLVIGIFAFTFFMVFGWDRAGVMAVVMAILRVIFDPKMSNEAKLQFIKEAVEKLIGIGLTIQNELEQSKKKEDSLSEGK